MKKTIPNILNVLIPYEIDFFENLHLHTIQEDTKNGYAISKHDLEIYCAILIRHFGLEKLPEKWNSYCTENGKIKDGIFFQTLRLKIQLNSHLNESDKQFYRSYLTNKIRRRKQIVKDEIKRIGVNPNKITIHNSNYYRTLLSIISSFDDEITLIRWYIPIKIKFDKIVHIFVKHVEETKFGEGQFKERSFFDYQYDQIWLLLRQVLKQEENSIKDHFLEISTAELFNEREKIKQYHRGFKKFPDIIYNGDAFALSIDINGYVTKFHQKQLST